MSRIIKLKDIAKIFDGTHQTPHYVDSGVPFYSVEHVTSGDFSKTKFISEEVFATESRRVTLEKGDILMTRIGDVGNAKYIDWDVRASFYVSLALLKCSEDVDSEFIAYMINSDTGRREIWAKTLHVAFPNKINLGDIGECTFSIPDKSTQVKIVHIIKTWDEFIKKLDKKIELKKNIKKGLMQKLLTGKIRIPGFSSEWTEVSLGDVSSIKTGKKDNQNKVSDGEYPFFVRSPNIERINSYSFDGEAILVPGEGNIGKIFHYINGKFDYHQRVYKISDFHPSLNGKYVHYYFVQNFAKEVSSGSVKATVDSLRLPTFKKFKLQLPPRDEQDKIVQLLQTVDSDIDALSMKFKYIDQQRKYLLNNLVSGKIRTPENLTMPAKEVKYA